jgi:hypothetical protein
VVREIVLKKCKNFPFHYQKDNKNEGIGSHCIPEDFKARFSRPVMGRWYDLCIGES